MKIVKSLFGSVLILTFFVLQSCSNKGAASRDIANMETRYTAEYPLDAGTQTLTWFVSADNVLLQYTNMGDSPFAKELSKRTGVNIQWINPPAGQEAQQVGVMIASGDLPDIMEAPWLNYPGGPQRLLNDGILLGLNDAIEKWAPNFRALIEEDPMIRKAASTDERMLYAFPFIRYDKSLRTFWGPFMRQDLLNKYGFDVPVTIDDWDVILHAVKVGESDDFVPLQFMFQNGYPNPFMQAYGVTNGLYLEDGKVHYGQYEEKYKNYLELFHRWYQDGLISLETPSFAQRQSLREAFVNRKIFADINLPGSGIGYYLDTAKSLDRDLELVAASYPKLRPEDGPRFGHWRPVADSTQSWAGITTAVKDIELAVKLLDYGYSDSGYMFYNFGIEGDSYILTPEDPELPIKFTEKILNPPGGESLVAMMAAYSRSNYYGPFIQAREYILNYMEAEMQKNALFTWVKDDYGLDKVIPQLTFSTEEINEAAQIQTDLATYIDESETAFIIGSRQLSDFEAYRAELRGMGIERLLELYQIALGRYEQR